MVSGVINKFFFPLLYDSVLVCECYQVDSRSAANSRQPMVTEKDGDLLHAVSGGSVRIEEKTRRLLAGGEGLDQKIKKKRSVGAVGNRLVTGERDTKRATHPKLNADSKLRSCDSHGFRYFAVDH